jgi:CarD family transcriptional regulator
MAGLTQCGHAATLESGSSTQVERFRLKDLFQVGDKAVYPVHGVAEVVALEKRDIGGSNTPVYILKIIETGLKIMVPTVNAGAVGLRELISAKQVKEVYAILKSRDVPRDTQTWNRRYREYMEKIKTGSVFEIAEVLRDLCVLRGTKDLSFGERRMLDTARSLLIKEIALAKGIGEDKVGAEIDAIFSAAAA